MRRDSLNSRLFVLALAVSLLLPLVGSAQLIPIKTVPLATGDQFMVMPSQNLGLGGLSIAITDSLLDPFLNPARGGWIDGSRLFIAPATYSITNNISSTRTLPAGVLYNNQYWFGVFSVALQQLSMPGQDIVPGIHRDLGSPYSPVLLRDKNLNNLYLSGGMGKFIGASDIAVGIGFSWASLAAVEGVGLLYPRSIDIEQSGNVLDYRFGLYGELPDNRFFEAILVHHRINITHDVTYNYFPEPWENNEPRIIYPYNVQRNVDKTRTWGIQLGYKQQVSEIGWHLGGRITVNRKTHPKIPNYELMNIPRDPGESWAYNFGVGLVNINGPAVFGLEVAYEPIWSHTWANAVERIELDNDDAIPVGGKTVDNRFQFSNWHFRIGLGTQRKVVGFQLGLQVDNIRYWLDQKNFVQRFKRSQRESWAEWTPTFGFIVKLNRITLRYAGRIITGTGQPGTLVPGLIQPQIRTDSFSGNFLIAPQGQLTLQESTVFSHFLTVTVPFGR